MMKQKKLIGILIFLSVSFFLFGKCPDDINVKSVLESENVEEMKKLSLLLIECPNHQDSLGMIFHKISIHYYYESEFGIENIDTAIIYTKKALEIRSQLFYENPNIDLGKSNHNLGSFYETIGRNKLAIKHLQNAVEIYKNIDRSRMLNSYLELALIHKEDGELEVAKRLNNIIINECKELDNEELQTKALLNLAAVLSDQKRFEESIPISKDARLLLEMKEVGVDLIRTNINLGVDYYQLNDYPNSIFNYKKAIKLFKDFQDYQLQSLTWNNLSLAYKKNGQENLALDALNQSLDIAMTLNSKESLAQCYNHYGEFYLSKKNHEKALSFFQKTIQTLVADFSPQSDFQNPTKKEMENTIDDIYLLGYLGDKAKTLREYSKVKNDSKYLSQAIELYLLGDGLIDQLRKQQKDADTKLFWRKEAIPFYEEAIEICYEMKDVENAFFFFEKSKAILLLEGLQASDALEAIPDSLQNDLRNIQRDILKTKETISSSSENSRDSLNKVLIAIQNDYDFLSEKLIKDYPKYYEVKFGTNVISLADFQKEFFTKKEKSSVQYFFGEKNVYAITIDSRNSKLAKIGDSKTILSEIETFRNYFKNSSEIENNPKDFLEKGHDLYSLLIKSLSVDLANELIIFPDGALANLPFEAMIKNSSDEISTASYLLHDHLISYGYSATIFSKSKKSNSNQQNLIAAYAPFADGLEQSEHQALPFSNDEISMISKKIQGVFQKNKSATKQHFIDNLKKYDVLHLSTHAYSSSEESKPHIVFADTSLYLSELYGLDIMAELVVLSACQTNIGKISQGEGVLSLGRGFTYTGAQSLVSSLWSVDARSTGNILSRFYDNLLNKENKPKALHEAKIAYLKNENIPSYEKSPYYWAGLVYYGDDRKVVLKKVTNGFYYWISGSLLFLIGSFFYLWKNKFFNRFNA